MTTDLIIVFCIIGAAVILFVMDKIRYDIVALLALFASVVTGVVPTEKAFSGFSDPVVITVATILIISAAISRSGFIDYTMALLSGFTEKPKLQIIVLAGMVMSLSAFMNNVGALAIFLPIALSFAKKAQRKPSELLMPLSFASLLGGMITLIGTPPNLIISRIRAESMGEGYSMFDFAPVGLGVCIVGLLYLSIGWRFLPKGRRGSSSADEQFSIDDYTSEILVTEQSKITGKTISDAEAIMEDNVSIIGLMRNNHQRLAPSSRMVIKPDDILIIESDTESLEKFTDKTGTQLNGSKETSELSLISDEIAIVEAVIRDGSELIGWTARELRLRTRFNVNLLAMRQQNTKHHHSLHNKKFRSGDVIVLQGNLDAMPETLKELGCLPLAERSLHIGRKKPKLMPAIILATAVLLTIFDVLPISIAFLGGVLILALMKIMRPHEMYKAVDGPILILLGAMIPVTEALQATGGTELIASFVANISTGLSGPAVLTVVLISSMVVTPFLNNAAAVLLMAPIAVMLANKLGFNPDAFLMAVAVGSSCDFLTPIGHQSNTLVMGPGGYKFTDYWRMGLPLSLLVIVTAIPLLLYFWPLS